MSADPESPAHGGVPGPAFSLRQRRQAAWITLGAVGCYLALRALPTGTNLHPVDFSVTGKGALELCDPANPQFIPVVAARSPVTLTLVAAGPVVTGHETRYTLTLATSSGRPIGPVDLLTAHTRKLHLLVVDPTLTDYQHLHPEPGARPGDWTFAFTPRLGGVYRVFADFTPVATARGLYASADVTVDGDVAGQSASEHAGDVALHSGWQSEQEGYRFSLLPGAEPIHARQAVTLVFTITRPDGGSVPMEPVMGAFAHLVAFDSGRSGFAHLHPNQADPSIAPDAVKPRFDFKLTIPQPGRYVIWAQVNLAGRETFVPFWFEVAP